MQRSIIGFFFTVILLISQTSLSAHCQIPCGIYHDHDVVHRLEEDIETMAKAVKQIETLTSETPINYNQIVRWVINKEKHADHFSEVMHDYFLKQRIKTDDSQQAEKVVSVHKMMVLTMKVKQNVDSSYVEALEQELKHFKNVMYPVPDGH